jgi:putative addiction module killer protein
MRLLYFVDSNGTVPFQQWHTRLDVHAITKITTTLRRLQAGNLASLKSVGEGVMEARIDWGPGYRIYLARQGDELIILLGGGTKSRQQADIMVAKQRWALYKQALRGC